MADLEITKPRKSCIRVINIISEVSWQRFLYYLDSIVSVPNVNRSVLAAGNDVSSTGCNATWNVAFEALAANKSLHDCMKFQVDHNDGSRQRTTMNQQTTSSRMNTNGKNCISLQLSKVQGFLQVPILIWRVCLPNSNGSFLVTTEQNLHRRLPSLPLSYAWEIL